MRSRLMFGARAWRSAARCGRSTRASGAVEFALIAPFLLVLALGTLQAGLVLGIAHSLEQITADAGRYAVVGTGADERRVLAERWMEAQAERYPLLVASRLQAATREAEGALVVSVLYDASYLPRVPLIGAVIDFPASIQRSATLLIP